MVALHTHPTTAPQGAKWRQMAERAAAKAGVPFRVRRLLRDPAIGWQAHAAIVVMALETLQAAQNLPLNERERLADVVRHRFTVGCLTSLLLDAQRLLDAPGSHTPASFEAAAKEAMREAQALLPAPTPNT